MIDLLRRHTVVEIQHTEEVLGRNVGSGKNRKRCRRTDEI